MRETRNPSGVDEIEGLLFDGKEVAREAGKRGVEVRVRMAGDVRKERIHPGPQIGRMKGALRRERVAAGLSRRIPGDQVAHHLAQACEVIFGFLDAIGARESEAAQVVAKLHERALVDRAREVVRRVQEDLGLAHALEERIELRSRRGDLDAPRRGNHLLPRALEEGARGRRLGGRQSQLLIELVRWRREEELREQAVDLGAVELLAVVGRAESDGRALGHRSVIFTSLGWVCRSMTRQSPHILSRSSAAPWNIECPASLLSIPSIAFTVPKGLPQRTQLQGCISCSTRDWRRARPASANSIRGTSDSASSGQVLTQRPHCTQFFSMK